MLRRDVECWSSPVPPISDRMGRRIRAQGRQCPILNIDILDDRSFDTFIRKPRVSFGEVSDQDGLEADSVIRSCCCTFCFIDDPLGGIPDTGVHGCDGCSFGKTCGCGVSRQVAETGIDCDVQSGIICSSASSISVSRMSLTSPGIVL
jgi:hypothetical protein